MRWLVFDKLLICDCLSCLRCTSGSPEVEKCYLHFTVDATLSHFDGGMVFTFLKAKGYNVGNSLVEDDQIELAQKLEILAKEKNVELFLAKDIVIADKFASDANTQIVNINAIPNGWMGLDIGPETITDIQNNLENCKTIIWNGPMGVLSLINLLMVPMQLQ